MLASCVEPFFIDAHLVAKNRFFHFEPTPDGFRVIEAIMRSKTLQQKVATLNVSDKTFLSDLVNWSKLAEATGGNLDAALKIISDG